MCNNFFIWFLVCLTILGLENHILALDIPAITKISRHNTVRPRLFHTRTKREMQSTIDSENTIHHAEVTITVTIDNEDFVLDLILNKDLVAHGHVISYQENGKEVQYKPKIQELELCQYSGVVRDRPNSWAAVSTCRGVRGVIYDGRTMRHIEPAEESGEINSSHYIYDPSDLQTSGMCGHDPSETDNQQDIKNTRTGRHKREIPDSFQIGNPGELNHLSRFVELVVVVSHGVYLDHGDIPSVHRKIKDLFNIVNKILSSLNIYVALVGVIVWNEKDWITISEVANETLKEFANYRREQLTHIKNDNAHLFIKEPFYGDKMGLAYTGTMCRKDRSVGLSAFGTKSIGYVATVIAHEMGHNLGMKHDDSHCKCDDCIMNAKMYETVQLQWSSCSLRSLSLSYDSGVDVCLRNKPKNLWESPTCGNGLLEPGEQCDCGVSIPEWTKEICHQCCDAKTCMLKSDAKCAAGECCDLKKCQPKSAGTMCRSAHKECDLPEYCTGHSEFCPRDVFKMDSTPCGKQKEAYCVAGSCKSHTDQCRMLWGITARKANDICYSDINDDCKCNGRTLTLEQCPLADIFCGRLWCEAFEPFRYEFVANTTPVYTRYINLTKDQRAQCFSVCLFDIFSDVDSDWVPDGAKCGENMMCMKRKCVSVESVAAEIAARNSSVCPSDCNGRGVCNSEGHCHCDLGFAPPNCSLPGPGGSSDSGPASGSGSTHHTGRTVALVVYILNLLKNLV